LDRHRVDQAVHRGVSRADARVHGVHVLDGISTSRQAEEGESLDVQQRTVAGYALMLGLTVDRMFVERGVFGSVLLSERAEGTALLAATKPGDVLITPKLDRMYRSALDALDVLAKLKARCVSLHMIDLGMDVTGNGISELVFTIPSAVAEAELDRIRERVTQVKRDQRQRTATSAVLSPSASDWVTTAASCQIRRNKR
jgi:DNA invertase Pin-like site-specific DNA recombinase